jgi:hypothetical protein
MSHGSEHGRANLPAPEAHRVGHAVAIDRERHWDSINDHPRRTTRLRKPVVREAQRSLQQSSEFAFLNAALWPGAPLGDGPSTTTELGCGQPDQDLVGQEPLTATLLSFLLSYGQSVLASRGQPLQI